MQNVLIISGHPNLEASNANKAILEQTLKLLPGAEVSRLDLLYPDYKIDVKAEQDKLLKADIVVWQFPCYWYALPALMKKYLDDVYVYGFAHGSTGNKLKGKKLILSFTTGATEDLYDYGKAMNYPIDDFMPPLIQAGKLCQMEVQKPIYSQGMQYIPNVYPVEMLEMLKAKAKEHAKELAKLVCSVEKLNK